MNRSILFIALARKLTLRVFQCDLVFPSRAPQYMQTLPEATYTSVQLRLSAGLVLRFGRL